MTERPILFSTGMIKAILDGRKTQTRRPLKSPQPLDILPMLEEYAGKTWVTLETRGEDGNHGRVIRCRYGVPGDRLWVRERWAHDDPDCKDVKCGNRDHIWWYANEEKIVADSFAGEAHWRPSIHMPRWASRIALEIVGVRVERLKEITQADVLAEGIKQSAEEGYWLAPLAGVDNFPYNDARVAYAILWDSLNAKRGFGWDVNPWVWVIEFKKVKL